MPVIVFAFIMWCMFCFCNDPKCLEKQNKVDDVLNIRRYPNPMYDSASQIRNIRNKYIVIQIWMNLIMFRK